MEDQRYSTDEEEFPDEEDLDEVYSDKVRQTQEIVVCGADVIALYPNLKMTEAAQLCYEAILETDIDSDGVDYQEIAIYIAMNNTSEYLIPKAVKNLVPRKSKKKGPRPGMTGAAALSGNPTHTSGQWTFSRTDFSAEEKRPLLAEAAKIGVTTVFKNHLYQFWGQTYLQSDGAPIGVRLSCGVARLVMNLWDKKFMAALDANNIKIETAFRYVDDQRTVLRAQERGWRWDRGQVRFRSTWQEENKELSTVERTSRALNGIMNSIIDFLKFKMEHEEMFEEKKLPTLDFKLWVEENKILFLYSFYQKEVANKQVIHKKSALSENVKVASLTQNLIRRMKNTSEFLSLGERLAVIEQFTEQVLKSGYSREQTVRIVTAGLVGYENKVMAKKLGCGLHKNAAEGAIERRRTKLIGKSSWFKSAPKSKTREKEKSWSHQISDSSVCPLCLPDPSRSSCQQTQRTRD